MLRNNGILFDLVNHQNSGSKGKTFKTFNIIQGERGSVNECDSQALLD